MIAKWVTGYIYCSHICMPVRVLFMVYRMSDVKRYMVEGMSF